jgi:uncharacterized protein (DUF983 family)
MNVSRLQIVARGLTLCCPNCGRRTLFTPRSFFRVNKVCPACGFQIEREGDEGFYLGSMSLNFGFTLIFFLTPVLLLAYFDVISTTMAIWLAGVGAFLVPVLVYRASRSWWLMNYYLLFPHHLPANGGSNDSRGSR